ncbi:KH domain-containing protein [candidate division KSB1 bacterium]|nr:KH domain-containing protein [candidate division KSB1 bacterium]
MREFVEYIVTRLVDEPGEIVISEVVGEKTVVYELRVAQDDIGNVIGKKGRIVRSIQTLLNAVSAKNKKKKPILEILKQPKQN